MRGRPAKQQRKALGLAEAPRGGSDSSRRQPALPGVASPRLAPLPAGPTPSRRAPGSAPRPLRRSLANPAPISPRETQRKGNSRSASRRPGFWERQSNGSTYGGPGAAGKFGGGLGSTGKIPCSALPPRGRFGFPARCVPHLSQGQHKPWILSWKLSHSQIVLAEANIRKGAEGSPISQANLWFVKFF